MIKTDDTSITAANLRDKAARQDLMMARQPSVELSYPPWQTHVLIPRLTLDFGSGTYTAAAVGNGMQQTGTGTS